ncbi:MAG: GNAT family N-acetyltransferase [Aristaeellaceae bacterium]
MTGCRETLRPLYEGMSCLHGIVEAGLHGAGTVWVDSPELPRAAMMAVGDFLLCGGEPMPAGLQMLEQVMSLGVRTWLIHAPDAWMRVAAAGCCCHLKQRCAFDPLVQPEDKPLRQLLAQGMQGLTVQPIMGEWIPWCRGQVWSEDFVSQFTDDRFEREGLGVLLLRDGMPVAGASSYVCYPGGLEVQLTTCPGWEGRGYATLAAAELILRAHARGVKATWDAANPASAHIAQKLGYQSMGKYCIWQTDLAK